MEKKVRKDWFRYNSPIGMAKPVRWQGWVCCGIFLLSIFLFIRILIVTHNGNPASFALSVVAPIVIFFIVTVFKSNYKEIVGVYRPYNIELEKNFENRYASPKKINTPIENNWKKQIYASSFFMMGLVTTGQGFNFLSKGNKIGFIIFIFAAIFFSASIFFYISSRNINKKQRSKGNLRRSTKIPSKSNRDSLPAEESYYYKGKPINNSITTMKL